jgi:putative ABC transport system substrate-binding protein
LLAGATSAGPARRLGVLHWEDRAGFDRERPGIFHALARKGWRESEALSLEWRRVRIDSPHLARVAAELVALSPHAILTESTVLTRALVAATPTVPIVTSVADPVASGFALSLGRPGRNVTGLCNRDEGYEVKSIEMLRAFAPRLSCVMLFFHSAAKESGPFADRFAAAAEQAGLRARLCLVGSLTQARDAVSDALRHGSDAAVIGNTILDESLAAWIAMELPRRGLPAICANGNQDDRFLVSFEQFHANAALRFATVIDKVLLGASAAGIAFERPDAAHVVVNRRIARAMGLEIPAEMRVRATRVIE